VYLSFFGMNENPFTITPDTDFFFSYGKHLEALNVLLVALHLGEGFIKVTGEVGTGKTLLCRKLMNTLDDKFEVAYIPNPSLKPDALLMALAEELGIVLEGNESQHKLFKCINQRLIELNAAGKHCVLCLDEAQTITEEGLECLRLLTNLETEKQKLLLIVLFGQPELDRQLSMPSLRQLRQRITFSYQLSAIDWKGLNAYLVYRLLKANYRGDRLFMPDAVEELYRTSQGIPRLINILCHKALIAAYGRGQKTVHRKHIRMAVKDTECIQGRYLFFTPRFVYGAIGVIGAITVALGVVRYDILPKFTPALYAKTDQVIASKTSYIREENQ